MTPLMIASEKKQGNVVALLLARGADIHATDVEGDNALHWASSAGERGMANTHSLTHSLAHSHTHTHIHIAGDVGIVRLLLSAGLSPSSLDNFLQTPLHLASVGNAPGVCLGLLQAYAQSAASVDGKQRNVGVCFADVDRNGHTPLSLALRRGPSHREVVHVIQ